MIFSFFYQLSLLFLALLYLPKVLYDYIVHRKYRNNIKERLGLTYPQPHHEQKPLLWMHAVSMGETKAIAPLVSLIHKNHPEWALLISSTTETGHQEAQKCMPFADYHIYMPLDFSFCVGRVLKSFKPKMVLLSETDVWWNFLRLSKNGGAHIAIVNGKLSARSAKRLGLIPSLGKAIYSPIELCCAQSEEYAIRFEQIGVPKVVVTGNLKFDFPINAQTPLLEIPAGSQLIVLGSTHPGEEKDLIQQLEPLVKKYPLMRIAIVPRHPERFDAVHQELLDLGVPLTRYSQLSSTDWQFLLVDAMGILAKIYSQASLAIVGGSYIQGIGGHNIIEPNLTGTPVLFGPNMFGQNEMVSLVHAFGSGTQVSINDVQNKVDEILSSPSKLESMRIACSRLTNSIRGATEKTYQSIKPWL